MDSRLKFPVSDLPVMKACCKTCPFKTDERGMYQNGELANTVIQRNLFNSQQICHGTETGKERTAHNRCKGYYDFSSTIYQRMGLEPEKHLK